MIFYVVSIQITCQMMHRYGRMIPHYIQNYRRPVSSRFKEKLERTPGGSSINDVPAKMVDFWTLRPPGPELFKVRFSGHPNLRLRLTPPPKAPRFLEVFLLHILLLKKFKILRIVTPF